ncbi:hypothetical protein SRHO_G00317070 [Serrasalmus rhombeus]
MGHPSMVTPPYSNPPPPYPQSKLHSLSCCSNPIRSPHMKDRGNAFSQIKSDPIWRTLSLSSHSLSSFSGWLKEERVHYHTALQHRPYKVGSYLTLHCGHCSIDLHGQRGSVTDERTRSEDKAADANV